MSWLTEFQGLVMELGLVTKVLRNISLAITPCESKGALVIALSQILQIF